MATTWQTPQAAPNPLYPSIPMFQAIYDDLRTAGGHVAHQGYNVTDVGELNFNAATGLLNMAGKNISAIGTLTFAEDGHISGDLRINDNAINPLAGAAAIVVGGLTERGVLEFHTGAGPADGGRVGQIIFSDKSANPPNSVLVNIQGRMSGSTAGNRGGSFHIYTKVDGGAVTERFSINTNGDTVVSIRGPYANDAAAAAAGVPVGGLYHNGGTPRVVYQRAA